MKKYLIILLFCLLLFNLFGCKEKEEGSAIAKGDKLSLINGVKLDYENSFFDDFTGGVSYDNWYIGKQYWGSGNGGVIPENVHYTDDGILELRGTGNYYSGSDIRGIGDVKDGRYTGSCLISKFLTTPGRYEVKMKVLPRIGACNAFWTFAYKFEDSGDLNNEIDIELPGGITASSTPSYENVLNTNYQTEVLKISSDTMMSDVMGTNFAFNDGEWHTFGFDWYTDPAMIVYYIDGVVTQATDLFVPSLQARLWLGVWFPVGSGFVGSANFEEDIMQVDYVKYIPFKDQPYIEYTPFVNGVAIEEEYPQSSTSLYVSNMISNGTFEYAKNHEIIGKGWSFDRYIDETKEVFEVTGVLKNIGYEDSYGAFVKDSGCIEQLIDATYEGFKYNLSFNARIDGKEGYVTVDYLGSMTSDKVGSESITIKSGDWDLYTMNLTCPKGCKQIRITFDTISGSTIYFDNVSMVR